jgi:hypothetical protein
MNDIKNLILCSKVLYENSISDILKENFKLKQELVNIVI